MAPSSLLPGLGQTPASASSAVTRPGSSDSDHVTLYHRWENLQRTGQSKDGFISVSATYMVVHRLHN
jgi:hypothetical protein